MNGAFSPNTTADITAVGAGISLTGVGSGAQPYPQTPGTDISGANDNSICFNLASGDSASNTITVTSTSTFNIYAYANGGAMNEPGESPYPGQDFANITVAAAAFGADHLVASVSGSPEANTPFTTTITQVNAGGGTVTSALADVAIGISVPLVADTLSPTIKASGAHSLTVGSIVKFTTGATDATKYYIVSTAPAADTFKVIGAAPNLLSSSAKLTAQGPAPSATSKAMSGAPGTVSANTPSTITMNGDTAGFSPTNTVTIAGCSGYYLVKTVTTNTSLAVVGPAPCSPTASGNVVKQDLTPASESAYTLTRSGAYISSVGGTPIVGITTTDVTGKTLASGLLALTIVDTLGESLAIVPGSATLGGIDVNATVTPAAASSLTIQGYGPPNGQVGMPTNAPLDFMFNKDLGGSFPLTNVADSVISITTGGAPVAGTWQSMSMSFGDNTFYKASFSPTAGMLAATKTYTISILKSFIPGGVSLPGGMTALTDTGLAYTSTITTGAGGGDFVMGGDAPGGMGGGFAGAFGGSVPPMANLGYPRPGSWDVPTNIAKISVDFDRAMDATTFTNANIYLKKIAGGVEVDPGVTTTVSPTTGTSQNAYLAITGTLSASSTYRVIVTRSVKDSKGTQTAGMPLGLDGAPQQGFGFGFENQGPAKFNFNTGTGTATITATLMGTNLDKYNSGGVITGVPTTIIPSLSFGNPLDPSTVNATTVTLKRGSSPTTGTVSYDGKNNTIKFIPSTVLLPSTAYTFAASTGVTSVTGTAISAVTKNFTTGIADVVAPQLSFSEADNYGFRVTYNEPMESSSAGNSGNYTLKTCTGAIIAADGTSCTGGGSVTTVSLMSGVNAHYDSFTNQTWFDGLTLTAGDGFFVAAGATVRDAASNAIDASYKTFTGKVMNAGNFAGGQGMQTMGNLEMKDFNMGTMGMTPISANPMNSTAGATTKYFIRFPTATQVPTGGWVELTFPTGFTVTGALPDSQSPMALDFNGPATGTPTFATNLTSVTPTPTDGGGAQANDGVGYIAAASKVYVKLSGATNASDFIQLDLNGITNSNEPKDPSTSGYSLQIKTFNTTGTLLEAMTSMPFFLGSAGTGSIGGQVTASGTGINGVTVYIGSPFTGPMETTTANNANGGGQDGEFKFSSLQTSTGTPYMIWTQPTFTAGITDYNGKPNPEPVMVTGTITKNLVISAANGTNGATQPVTLNYSQAGLSAVSSLGFGDSIDIFAGGPKGFAVKTVARASLTGTSYTANLFIPTAGEWMVGIGPAMPKGPMAGPSAQINWMPGPPKNVTIATADIGGSAKTAVLFSIGAADKTITGKVIDASGTAIANADIFGYNPKGGTGSHATSTTDGTFSMPVSEGPYKVGASLAGMPSSGEVAVLVSGSSFYVDGSPTASTGSSAGNPFNLKINKSSSALTIQGRVTDGTNAIPNAAVWAHRTDSFTPPINTQTDSTGNYTIYVTTGTWEVESDAPGFGYLGSKTLTVTESLTSQDFTVASSGMGSISGTINIPATSDDSGTIVTAYCTTGTNETVTKTDGTYLLNVTAGTCTVDASIPGTGDVAPLTVVVDGAETGKDFTIATPRTFTITLSEAVSEDTQINLYNTTGQGNEVVIAAGSTSASLTVQQGAYYLDANVPGMPFSSLTIAGAEFDNVNGTPSANNAVDIDNTGDNITLTLPTLYSVSGQVTAGGTGVNDVLVSVYNTTSKQTFSVTTANNAAGGALDGEYLGKLPAGTYSISVDKTGYAASPIDVVVAATSPNNDIVLTANSKTITGTVTAGTAASGAKVYAQASGGGFSTTTTSTDGTYTLAVKPGIWTINAITDGYSAGTEILVDTTDGNATGKNFTLTALTGGNIPTDAQTETVIPGNGGIVEDPSTDTKIVIPPNAFGSGSTANQITTKEVSDVFSTATATPIGYGQEVSAIDSNKQAITKLDNGVVTISLNLTTVELAAAGVTTSAQADQVAVGYWDTNNWVTLPATTKEFYDVAGNIIAADVVSGAASLTAASVDHITLVTDTDHFTTFAPILPTGPTPPATPATPVATAGNAQATLTWTKNSESDMSSYNIWEANVSEGVVSTLTQAACGASTCSKTITGLTNGTAYSYQIIAIDTDSNESAGSTAASVTPVAPAATTTGGGGAPLHSDTNSAADTQATTQENATTTTPFLDVASHWAKLFIEDLYAKQIIAGVDATHYNPDAQITRAEFTKIAINMFGIQMDNNLTKTSFKDVKIADWFAPYIEAAHKGNIVVGYTNSMFKPNQPINRAEAMKILLTTAKIAVSGATYENKFPDVKAGIWYADYINYAAKNGIVNGYQNGTFGPANNLTRGEVAKIASLLLAKTKN
jgi:hypothetical protein